MIKWTVGLSLAILFSLLFLFPSKVLAATIPYTITEGIASIPIEQNPFIGPSDTFYIKEFEINYQGGEIVASGNSDGTGKIMIDDGARFFVTYEDGNQGYWRFNFDNHCWFLQSADPIDLSYYFKPGKNQIRVEFFDNCGGAVGSWPLYLVNLNAPNPTPSPSPTPTKTPLVFIPGIGGSEFKSNETFTPGIRDCDFAPLLTYLKDDVVWVNVAAAGLSLCDDYFDVLKLKSDGFTPEYPQIVLNNTIFQWSYGETIEFLKNMGYEPNNIPNQTLYVFPYDWRKDIAQTAGELDSLIEEIKQKTGHDKVDILAHSMGGLVAKNYLSDPSKTDKVRKLIALGSPNLVSRL